MIQHEFQDRIDAFMEVNDRTIKTVFERFGRLAPQFGILIYDTRDKTFSIEVSAIDEAFVSSERGKDLLAYKVLPSLMQGYNESGITILCVSLAVEAWMTQIKHETSKMPTDEELRKLQREAKSLPKKEIVMITYETEHSSKMHSMEILREGQARPTLAAPDTDAPDTLAGRFIGLLKQQPKLN